MKSIVNMQNKFNKSVNNMNNKDMPFNKSPQSDMPPLNSENATNQYLDNMNEVVQVPEDVNIDNFDFSLDNDFKSFITCLDADEAANICA